MWHKITHHFRAKLGKNTDRLAVPGNTAAEAERDSYMAAKGYVPAGDGQYRPASRKFPNRPAR